VLVVQGLFWFKLGTSRLESSRAFSMFLVKTYLDKSSIHGIGVFAGEFIPQGKKLWEFTLGFDRRYSLQELHMLPSVTQALMHRYAFAVKGQIFYSVDNDCYTNHANIANTAYHESGYATALRDIAKGEEITDNYRSFDGEYCAAFLYADPNDSR
jgi:SET domain-containing protein